MQPQNGARGTSAGRRDVWLARRLGWRRGDLGDEGRLGAWGRLPLRFARPSSVPADDERDARRLALGPRSVADRRSRRLLYPRRRSTRPTAANARHRREGRCGRQLAGRVVRRLSFALLVQGRKIPGDDRDPSGRERHSRACCGTSCGRRRPIGESSIPAAADRLGERRHAVPRIRRSRGSTRRRPKEVVVHRARRMRRLRRRGVLLPIRWAVQGLPHSQAGGGRRGRILRAEGSWRRPFRAVGHVTVLAPICDEEAPAVFHGRHRGFRGHQ
jgi:hypothetical protein